MALSHIVVFFLISSYTDVLTETSEQELSPCTKPELPHGYFSPKKEVYDSGSTVYYACSPKYKPLTEGWWGTTQCINGQWSDSPQCISRSYHCDAPPHIEHAVIIAPYQRFYQNGSRVEFRCEETYEIKGEYIFCENGEWSQKPECILQTKLCDAPPHVEHATIIGPLLNEYNDGSQVEYSCEETHEIQGQKLIFCEKGQWSQIPECIRSTDVHLNDDNCEDPPALENGDTISERPQNNVYKHGDKVKYQCKQFYKMSGSSDITCQRGQWTKLPTCLRPCIIPTPIDDRYNLKNPRNTEYVEEGMKFRFHCKDNFFYYDSWNYYYYSAYVLCINGDIEYPTCERYRRY
ncbi:complement factor H-like isoform X2 [Lepisosteus oculatus]|uniref:complement factor H-like isoform X2 n=1 Tax=Lepisosteus oculatus TaxID=7918 RepID=UPI00371479DC